MYRCDKCGLLSWPGEKRVTVPVEWREHVFPFRKGANNFWREGKVEKRDDRGGVGKQITKEIGVHERCAYNT